MIFEGTITFRLRAPSQQVAELYVDGLCTAMRYNKPEIAGASVQWNLAEVSDDLTNAERQFDDHQLHVDIHHDAEKKLEIEEGSDG